MAGNRNPIGQIAFVCLFLSILGFALSQEPATFTSKKIIPGCNSNNVIMNLYGVWYCRQCDTGYYPSVDQTSCFRCSSQCETCINSATSCTKCAAGHYTTATMAPFTCTPCMEGCRTCYTSATCDLCNPGYYLGSDRRCGKCVSNCKTCNGPTGCSECMSGYNLDSKTQTCSMSGWGIVMILVIILVIVGCIALCIVGCCCHMYRSSTVIYQDDHRASFNQHEMPPVVVYDTYETHY